MLLFYNRDDYGCGEWTTQIAPMVRAADIYGGCDLCDTDLNSVVYLGPGEKRTPQHDDLALKRYWALVERYRRLNTDEVIK